MTTLGFGDLPLQRMYGAFDTHGTGAVDFREFLVGLSTLRCHSENREAALGLVFRVRGRGVGGLLLVLMLKLCRSTIQMEWDLYHEARLQVCCVLFSETKGLRVKWAKTTFFAF